MDHGTFLSDGQSAKNREDNTTGLTDESLETHQLRNLDPVEVALHLRDPTTSCLRADVDAECGQRAEAEVDETRPAEGLDQHV